MKNKYLFVIVLAFLSLFLAVVAKGMSNKQVFESQINVEASDDLWKPIMAQQINNHNIRLYADGVLYEDIGLYMSDKLELMIDIEKISAVFDCAENLYKDKLVIEKGATRVELYTKENKLLVNEKEEENKFKLIKKEGIKYISTELFVQYFNYKYQWDGQEYIATVQNLEPDERTIPFYYSYEYEDKSPKVRTQGKYGTCWAFAALTALESSLRPEENMVFSVDHMVLCNSFLEGMYDGGDYNMSIAYLAAWQGPVLESDDPYDGTTDENLKPVKHVQEIQIIDSKNYQSIKEMVYKYGGVQSSLYTSLLNSTDTSTYYNSDNYSYCYIGENKPNHDVVIIGWDDNYPKENFNADVEEDGAFICRNSWGKDFGENGNFYVSYYDSNIGVHNIVYTGIEDTDNYDNIYQADLCGWVGNLGYKDENTAYFANVYTANKNESIEAVGFYATDMDTEYEVYVVPIYKNEDSLENSKIFAASGSFGNQGYYTVKLNNSYSIKKGNKFAVIVKATTPNSTKPVPIEYVNDERTQCVTIDDGQGYISLNGNKWERTEDTDKCNVCLKAFTNDR